MEYIVQNSMEIDGTLRNILETTCIVQARAWLTPTLTHVVTYELVTSGADDRAMSPRASEFIAAFVVGRHIIRGWSAGHVRGLVCRVGLSGRMINLIHHSLYRGTSTSGRSTIMTLADVTASFGDVFIFDCPFPQ